MYFINKQYINFFAYIYFEIFLLFNFTLALLFSINKFVYTHNKKHKRNNYRSQEGN